MPRSGAAAAAAAVCSLLENHKRAGYWHHPPLLTSVTSPFCFLSLHAYRYIPLSPSSSNPLLALGVCVCSPLSPYCHANPSHFCPIGEGSQHARTRRSSGDKYNAQPYRQQTERSGGWRPPQAALCGLCVFFFASYSVHNSVSPPLPTASSRRRVLKQVRACVTKSTAPPPPPPLPLLRSNPVLLSATYLLRCLFAFRLCFVFTCSSLFQKCAHYLIVQHSPLHVCVCARVCLGRVSLSLCMRDGVSS